MCRPCGSGGSTRKYKAPVAIAAVDIAAFINFKPDTGVAKGCAARNIACPIAGNTAAFDSYGFRLVNHAIALAQAMA